MILKGHNIDLRKYWPDFSQIFSQPIYVVGGAVRDLLNGVDDIADVDIASAIHPEEFNKLCRKLGYKTIPTGIDHGTVTVFIDGHEFEHTTFREDVSTDGRNATVKFSKTIEEDLSRRDFTINAIAILDDELLDPYDGLRDLLENRLLRTVGTASERFSEDYLRIVRAARFGARFGLKLDAELFEAAQDLSHNIPKHVSFERVSDELKKSQKFADQFIKNCEEMKILSAILPEWNELNGNQKYLTFVRLERAKALTIQHVWAALVYEILSHKLLTIDALAKRFKMSNETKKFLNLVLKYNDFLLDESSCDLASLRDCLENAKGKFADLELFSFAVFNDSALDLSKKKWLNEVLESVKQSLEQALVDGATLKKLGMKPGPQFKDMIRQAGVLQAEGKNFDEIIAILTK